VAGCVYVDRAFFAPEEARVSAFDRGLLYGDGVFESLRTYSGSPFRLEAHLARLAIALDEIGIVGAPSSAELQQIVAETLARAKLPEAYLRITVTRGKQIGGGHAPRAGIEPTVMVAALPLQPYPVTAYERGVSAVLLWPRNVADRPAPAIKSTSFQRGVLGKRHVASRDAQEGLYLDGCGNVTEGTASNVFVVENGALHSPPPSVCLAGVTRSEVLAIARYRDFETVEAPVSIERLYQADEVFLTSSLAELLPVVEIEGRPVGSGRPGPLWRRLWLAYRDNAIGTRDIRD
jgi:branched-chain amino acid aminotransferase